MCKSKNVVHAVGVSEENETESDDDSEELFIGTVESTRNESDWFEVVKVHNKKFSVKLDSGAHCNVVPLWLVKQLGIGLHQSKTKWLVSFSNHRMKVLGEIYPVCRIKNRDSNITFKVVEESVVPVLGKDTCIAQRLIARVDTVQVLDETVFNGLGCLKDYVYDIDLIPNAQWETRPARHVPHSIRAAVKKELDSMERLGVIEKIHTATPVVNAMVLVKRNDKLRICIDPSQMTKSASTDLKQHSDADLEMQSLKAVIMQGWPESRNDLLPELRKYWGFRDELTVYDGLIFKSNQVLIPHSMRNAMLVKIHSGHSGIQSCIRRARQVLFWIGMASDIQEMVENCAICQRHQRNNTKSTIILKDIPGLPFERVASDLFHLKGKEYLLLVDSFSGYFDFKQLSETTSNQVIQQLKEWFCVHGIPQILETDNGPQYASEAFRQFSRQWGFEHQTSSPHFPRANGLAERSVQVAKSMLKKCSDDQSDIRLALLHMRNTPRSSLIPSPNERLMGRLVRSNMPMTLEALRPRVAVNVQQLMERERMIQKNYADRGTQEPSQFAEQEQILVQDQSSQKWTPGTVVKQLDHHRSYLVSDGDRTVRRNAHHLRKLRGGGQVEEPLQENLQPEDDLSASVAEASINRRQHSTIEAYRENVTAAPQMTRSGRTVKPKRCNEYEYY
ncbi:uncharacterized protein K02A2.6-like [Armigeres subalbatus]|uniref:uncharacterized protein K02A2.6-like n=1 Tax=Armigeres subalbatus TaxID=124917 RepID=UPI002ED16AB6